MKIGIVGSANAGKSSLFNRLVGSHRAIVTDIPGTTKELLRDHAQLHGMRYELVDSPGLYDFDAEMPFIEQIVKEADIFIFVINHRVGLTPNDKAVIDLIRRAGKSDRTMVLINKVDSATVYETPEIVLAEYYSMGVDHLILTSTQHGYGMEALIDWVTDHPGSREAGGTEHIHIAIVGKPNNGKSTLINKLCRTMVAHVSDVAGTTLDYLMGEASRGGAYWRVYDTAGIRRKGKIHGLERIALEKTRSMIKFIKPIVFLMVDANEGWTNGDMTLLGEMIEMAVPCIVILNKTDLLNDVQLDELTKSTKQLLTRAPWIPIVTMSARDEIGIDKAMRRAKKIHDGRDQRISTHKLNDTLKKAWLANPPRFPKNKICKFYYVTQVSTKPLTVVLFINDLGKANFAFTRWVQNVLRGAFGLDGVPIVIKFKDKEEDGQKWETRKGDAGVGPDVPLGDMSEDEDNAPSNLILTTRQDLKPLSASSKRILPNKPSDSRFSHTKSSESKPLSPRPIKASSNQLQPITGETSPEGVKPARFKPTRKDGHPLRRTRLAKKSDKQKIFIKGKKDEKQTANLDRKQKMMKAKKKAKK